MAVAESSDRGDTGESLSLHETVNARITAVIGIIALVTFFHIALILLSWYVGATRWMSDLRM
jgi:hypothetical protein